MLLEVKLSLRRMRSKRTAFLGVLLISSLSTGLLAAISGAVYRLMVAPLSYPEADRLVRITGATVESGSDTNVSPPDFRDIRQAAVGLARVAAVSPFTLQFTHRDGGAAQVVTARLITAEYFSTIGVPVKGREFTAAEERAPSKSVLIGERFWRTRLQGRPPLNSTLVLDGQPHQIVGIVPDQEEVFTRPDVWLPLQFPSDQIRALRIVAVVGRMREGVRVADVHSALQVVSTQLQARYPATNGGWKAVAAPLSESIAGPARPATRLMLVLIGLLGISTAAALALWATSNALEHQAEMAVRRALGASWRHRCAPFLVEQAVIAAASATAGIMIARSSHLAFVALGVLRDTDSVSATLLIAASAGASACICVIGTAVAVTTTSGGRRLGGRSNITPLTRRRYGVLAGAQVAIAAAVLSIAAAVTAGAWSTRDAAIGFEPAGSLHVPLHLPPRYAQSYGGTWSRILEEIQAIPGIVQAALTSELPFTGQENPTAFTVSLHDGRQVHTQIRSVSPGYFSLARLGIRHGRGLLPDDKQSSEKVVVISETLRRVAFGESSGVDASLTFNFASPPFRARVIGVVGDVRHGGPTSEPQAEAYFPIAQTPLPGYTLAVRTPLTTSAARASIVAAVERIDRDIAVPNLTSWQSTVHERYRVYYWRAALSALVGATVSLLCSIAIHGAILRALLERRQEFAVRTALGASHRSLAFALTWDLARICTAAAALGGCAGFVLIRFAAAKLVGVAERPLAFSLAAVALACLTVAIAACGPLRAAGRQDTARLLRS